MLKSVLSIEEVCRLLSYVNGELDNESDDRIDDAQLYFMFVKLAAQAKELYHSEQQEEIIDRALADYREPSPGSAERVKAVLKVMLTAWLAARMVHESRRMLNEL